MHYAIHYTVILQLSYINCLILKCTAIKYCRFIAIFWLNYSNQSAQSERYTKVRELGQGSVGSVWLAECKSTGAKFAMKLFNSDEDDENIRREIHILSKVSHHHLVKIYDVIDCYEKTAIVMEYCKQGDLKKYLRERQGRLLSENQVWAWLSQLTSAMAYLMRKNIVHRDIKPANVMLDNNCLKLADFGLGRVLNSAYVSNQGTFAYRAPELFSVDPRCSFKSDMFALGCVVYEMCALVPAFDGKLCEVIELIIENNPTPLSDTFSQDLKSLVQQMMSDKPSDRPNADDILRRSLVKNNLPEMLHPRTKQQDATAMPESNPPATSEEDAPSGSYPPTLTPSINLPRRLRLTDEEMLKFNYEGLKPVEANEDGSYEPFHWQEEEWLFRWSEILTEKNSSKRLPLPPLIYNKDNMNLVTIVIYCIRNRSEFLFCGGFHSKVEPSVVPFNVQLDLSLTFTMKGNTKWTVDKQMVATMEHGLGKTPLLFALYDVPFASLSSSSAPSVTKIAIKRISPSQKWFHCGLEPRISRDGKFDTIDCDSLYGTFECAREWRKIVEYHLLSEFRPGFLCLPPLVLSNEIAKNAAVCVFGQRSLIRNELQFYAKFHQCTHESVQSREMLFKIELHVSTQTNTVLVKQAENAVTVKRQWADLFTFTDPAFSSLSPTLPPRLCVSILPAFGCSVKRT